MRGRSWTPTAPRATAPAAEGTTSRLPVSQHEAGRLDLTADPAADRRGDLLENRQRARRHADLQPTDRAGAREGAADQDDGPEGELPAGVYTLAVDGSAEAREWQFVVAGHACVESDILRFLHQPQPARVAQ